ncbi:hypothetical protein O181_045167 [Austropuccinia psidii MF-1]|uniref:Uncharacterized protein n=1 Tax=Austropuccinia psidii MF-1 TaxID=1389203 RepID=A0A9Q3HIH1_9BASI|nr:hypothetical protein [Austropuccinia psidii MF-1]
MGPEKTEEFLRGWTPISYKGQVQQIKAWLKAKAFYQRTKRRSWPKERTTALWKLSNPPQARIGLKKCKKMTSRPQRAIRRERQNTCGTILTHRITEFQITQRQPWPMYSIWQEL